MSAAKHARCGFSAARSQKTSGRVYRRTTDARYSTMKEVNEAASATLRRLGEPFRPLFNMRRAK
jgi:hypothetical protein